MTTIVSPKSGAPDVLQRKEISEPVPEGHQQAEAFAELERGVHAALETYANVHRGSGHSSLVSTHLYEQAREIVLEHLGLSEDRYTVVFCSPRRAEALMAQLQPGSYQSLSSQDIGLPLGVRALAVDRKALPKGVPFQTGGGTARLVSPGWVIWAKAPDKFEAGTPAIVNVIAFAAALRLIRRFGKDAFRAVIRDGHGATAEENPTAEDAESAEAEMETSASSARSAVIFREATDILYHDELEQYSGRELLAELRQTLIGRGVCVPTVEGMRPFINLDNAASTPTFTPIWDAVCQTWRQPKQVQQEIVQGGQVHLRRGTGCAYRRLRRDFHVQHDGSHQPGGRSLRNESEPGSRSGRAQHAP